MGRGLLLAHFGDRLPDRGWADSLPLKIAPQPARKEGRGRAHLVSETEFRWPVRAAADASYGACHVIVVDFDRNYPASFVPLLSLANCQNNSTGDKFTSRSEQIVKTPI